MIATAGRIGEQQAEDVKVSAAAVPVELSEPDLQVVEPMGEVQAENVEPEQVVPEITDSEQVEKKTGIDEDEAGTA